MAHEVGVTRLNTGQDYAVTIPEGYAAGDIVVIRLLGKVFVEAGVLEELVRAYHERDDVDGDEPARMRCRCGWTSGAKDRLSWPGQHAAHVEFSVREALAGRAAL